MHGYDFYQINLYVFNKFHIFYKLQWLLRSLQWKLGRDQKYSLSGDYKRNVNYGTCIKYPDLEQCQSRFSLFKFLINVSTFLISWIKSLFFSKQRHTSVSVQTDFGVIVFTVIAYKNIFISSMD